MPDEPLPHDASDDDLLAALAGALAEAQDVPASVAASGRALYVWRTVDAELAELVHDSADDLAPAPSGVRDGGGEVRSLSYRWPGLLLEVDVEHRPAVLRGQLVASEGTVPDQVSVDVVDGSSTTAAVDAGGWFAIEPFLTRGRRFRLRCGSHLTPWID